MSWGITPDNCRDLLNKREWENRSNLRKRLTGNRQFPLELTLKAPNAKQALSNLERYRQYVKSWADWPNPNQVQWNNFNFHKLGEQRLPVRFCIHSMNELIEILGEEAKEQSRYWQVLMKPVLEFNQSLYPVLIKHLVALEKMSISDMTLLAHILPQLNKGMGQGGYLRALPLLGADTKFLESSMSLVSSLLDEILNNEVSESGGLLAWLDCKSNPNGWLGVRPLCTQSQSSLSQLPLFQLSTCDLRNYPLTAKQILVVENVQSGLALPMLENTIAIFGGGKNVSWMDADWLLNKKVGYWGDIDTWGFSFLDDARKHVPQIESIMMDKVTLAKHSEKIVDEPISYTGELANLTDAEESLFNHLISCRSGTIRLEQERLSMDYITEQLNHWLIK